MQCNIATRRPIATPIRNCVSHLLLQLNPNQKLLPIKANSTLIGEIKVVSINYINRPESDQLSILLGGKGLVDVVI